MSETDIQLTTDIGTRLAKFEAAREKIIQFADQCKNCVVNSVETHESAKKLAMDAGKIEKIIEDKRKEITKPLLDAKKQVDDFVKNLTQDLNESKSELRGRILAYEKEQDNIRQEELRRLQIERMRIEDERRLKEQELLKQAAENQEVDQKLMNEISELREKEQEVIAAPVLTEQPKSNIRKTWDWELIDISQVPVAYLMPYADKIKEAIKEGERNIPGIRIYQKETLSLR